MTGRGFFLLLLQLIWLFDKTWAQRSSYSLQAAVDQMHRREAANYPLNAPPSQQHYFSALGSPLEQDYWDDDNGSPSVFRERDSHAPEHSELTDQFLREIEETQEHEREQRYKEALRHLWEKYQQQENEIEGDLFEEKKRMRVPPYYMLMQKKRSYPVLPWLPYSERRKRFPVAKRSTKRSANGNANLGKTDERVARELSELFGEPMEEKKKRSTDEQTKGSIPTLHTTEKDVLSETLTKKSNVTEGVVHTTAATAQADHQHNHGIHHEQHSEKEHKHRKRSNHSSHESHEEEEYSEEHDHEHDEHEEHDDEHESHESEESEEEKDQRKKKRDITNSNKSLNTEIIKGSQIIPSDSINFRRKKSIQWSKYFGIDRKKKAFKRDPEDKKLSNYQDSADDEERKENKRDLDPEKLENMDKKLQSIEDFIIDETIKYTGAHEGIANPDEIRRLKDHVLSRLATAYSLEKMRRALEKLRQSVDKENHLLRNVIESESRDDDTALIEKEKRLSVKKESVPLHEHQQSSNEKSKEINSNAMMSSSSNKQDSSEEDQEVEDDDGMKKKKKKRNSYLRYPELPNEFLNAEDEVGTGRYESLNDAYLGNKNYMVGSNQCPLIESMAERCRGVDILSGDINQELLPLCGVHQICYLCGTSQVACDYQYLAEADQVCGENGDCQAAVRSVLMILRGTPGPQLGPRECLKNPCLYSAMREIGL